MTETQGAGAKPITSDMVNSPSHYTKGGIETSDYIKAKLTTEEYCGYIKGTLIAYASRLGDKDDPIQEAGKIEWYARDIQEYLKSKK